MANKWSIKISESENPNLKGFYVTVENNDKYVGGIKGIISDFNRAIEEGKAIILSEIKSQQDKMRFANQALDIFTKKFLMNKMLNGIYGAGVFLDEKGEPYIEASMDTKNEYLMKLVPDTIEVPHTPFKYNINKVYGEQAVAQSKAK